MILLGLALLASSPADAAPTASPAAVTVTAPPKPADDLDKVICHVDTETGTRLGSHKECHTKRDWVQMQNENSNMLERATTVMTAGGPH